MNMEVFDTADEADLDDIVQTVFSMCVGVEAERVPSRAGPPEGERVVASVAITGAWSGAVAVSCSAALARRAAEAMFGTSQLPSEEEARDALREVANIIAGNYKSLVAGPSRLSLPVMGDGQLARPDEGASRELWFDCGGDLLVIRVAQLSHRELP